MPEDKTKVSYGAVIKMMENASTEEAILKGKTLVVAYEFEELGGWTVRGEASVVDPANFDIAVGRELCKKRAAEKLWQDLGLLNQLLLADKITWVGERPY